MLIRSVVAMQYVIQTFARSFEFGASGERNFEADERLQGFVGVAQNGNELIIVSQYRELLEVFPLHLSAYPAI